MFRILHLSDLHMRTDDAWSTTPILMDARRVILDEANKENVDVVVFTGDIATAASQANTRLPPSGWMNCACDPRV